MIKIKYPKNQTPLETICDEHSIPKFLITRDSSNEYILHSIDEKGNITKLKQANSPTKFEDTIKKG